MLKTRFITIQIAKKDKKYKKEPGVTELYSVVLLVITNRDTPGISVRLMRFPFH